MCGFVGIVGECDTDTLKRMNDVLAHRGPDGEGQFADPQRGVYLGHRRLSILDIEHGDQPMWTEARDLAVVFNGEIYNHRDLRKELEALGHRFQSTHSDTEVLLHGYRQWGTNLPKHLNGMFAFAIYDVEHTRIFLARDRFGEKPLYVTHQRDFWAFASELTAFQQHPRFDSTLDTTSLMKFFAHGFFPGTTTRFRNTHKIEPGSWQMRDTRTGELTSQRYWTYSLAPDDRYLSTRESEIAEDLLERLQRSTKRCLDSDVPVGTLLSGGIDSSAITALTAELAPDLSSFTIGFDEPSFDESDHARLVADHLRIDSKMRLLNIGTAKRLMTEILPKLDEPTSDPSIVPTYMVSAFAREHITVALSGDGADELFAGYDPFLALTPAKIYSRIVPRPITRLAGKLADRLPVSPKNMSLEFRLRRFLSGLEQDKPFWNAAWLGALNPEEIGNLFGTPIGAEELYSEVLECWDESPEKSLGEQTLEFYGRFYLPNNILMKVDRASMLNSLEIRSPFLDNEVIDLAMALPFSLKLRGGERKYILKRALSQTLPRTTITRTKKGFGMPTASWLRSVPDPPPPASSIPNLDAALVERYWWEHRTKKRDHRMLLWSWLSLQQLTPA